MKRRRRRDFWRAWEQQQQQFDEDSGQHSHQWRVFFHDRMGSWPEEHWVTRGRRFHPWHQGTAVFNPFVASVLSKGGGLLPLLLLRLLEQKPRYGNELMELIATATGGQWIANPGAVYPLLTQLEKRGLVSGVWEDPHKRTVRIYRLTSEGHQELERLDALVRPKLEEAIDVLGKLVMLLDESDGPLSDEIVSM